MKKNAILVAAILFITGCANQQGGYGRAGTESGTASSRYSHSSGDYTDTGNSEMRSEDLPTALEQDPAVRSDLDSRNNRGVEIDADADREPIIDDSRRDTDYAAESTASAGGEIRADSSIRGGSARARGWDLRQAELEDEADPMNPAFRAESSIRGGFTEGRDREFNRSNAEPEHERFDRQIKADSSIRGGSDRARGWDRSSRSDDDGSFQSSMSWDDVESEIESEANLNASTELEKNIAGEYDLDGQRDEGLVLDTDSEMARESYDLPITRENELFTVTPDPNAEIAFDSSTQSLRPSDLAHDASDFDGPADSGAAAGSEIDQGSSAELESRDTVTSFEAELDPAEHMPESQLGVTTSEPNWLYESNPAQGVGSAQSPETAKSARFFQEASMGDDELARSVKGALTRDNTGTHGPMPSEVARNVVVTANGGVVTLKGTVPSQKDKDLLAVQAREVRGVQRVDNQLTVSEASDPANRDLGRGHDIEELTDQLKD